MDIPECSSSSDIVYNDELYEQYGNVRQMDKSLQNLNKQYDQHTPSRSAARPDDDCSTQHKERNKKGALVFTIIETHLNSLKQNCDNQYFYHHTVDISFLTIISCIISVCYGQCDEALSCVGQSLNDSVTTVRYINGYKAAFGASTSWSGRYLYCSGSYSCHSMLSIHNNDGNTACYGTQSCSNTTINSNTIYCNGANACSNSNLMTTNAVFSTRIDCSGYQSCSNSYIGGFKDIYAQGELSLLNTIIDTNGSASTNILHLSASLAGYGAKLLCREGHICNIYCDGLNSCLMFYTECQGECNIFTQSVNTIFPTINITELDSIDRNISQSMLHSAIHDELCIIDSCAFDDYREQFLQTINIAEDAQNMLCCRARESCGWCDIPIQENLLCSGYGACRYSVITSKNNSIFCESASGCQESSIIDAAHVDCAGAGSCQISVITKSSLVTCSGFRSCSSATLMSGGNNLNVYFTGYQSGLESNVHCNDTDLCNVYCIGVWSCIDTKLFCHQNCSYNVECDDEISKCPEILGSKPPTMYFALNATEYHSLHPISMPSLYPTIPPSEVQSTPFHYSISHHSHTNQTPINDIMTTSLQKPSDLFTSNEVTVDSTLFTNNTNVWIVISWISIVGSSLCCCVAVTVFYFAKPEFRMMKMSQENTENINIGVVNDSGDDKEVKQGIGIPIEVTKGALRGCPKNRTPAGSDKVIIDTDGDKMTIEGENDDKMTIEGENDIK